MQYISSDTCVWIDFSVIRRIELPFRLPYTYIINKDAISDELNVHEELGNELIAYGLEPVAYTTEEFDLAESFETEYIKLSRHDRLALAIAKTRGIVLLTGDKRLRAAAVREGVKIMGTLGLLDQLIEQNHINAEEYKYCLQQLQLNNGKKIRLPGGEITLRLRRIQEKEQ